MAKSTLDMVGAAAHVPSVVGALKEPCRKVDPIKAILDSKLGQRAKQKLVERQQEFDYKRTRLYVLAGTVSSICTTLIIALLRK